MNGIPDDFAYLSDDIVFDVLQFAYFERMRGNYVTKSLGGRWGEIAGKFRESKLEDNEITESRLNGDSESFNAAAKNRKDVAVNSICFSGKTDFNKIQHLAANAYERLEVDYRVIPKEFLEILGNRFTRIIWFSGNQGQTEIDFLKRQLKSPHLRILRCNNPVLKRPDFMDLLVDFVRKKNFQTLNLNSNFKVLSFITESISERVFLAAYEAWLQRREGEHLLSSISAPISTEDLRKLTARIPNCRWKKRSVSWEPEWSYSEKHPTADHYEMRLSYDDFNFGPSDAYDDYMSDTSDVKKLHMSFSELLFPEDILET